MKDFMNILVAVLIMATVPQPGYGAVPECADDTVEVCFDCSTRGDCSGATTAPAPAVEGAKCPTGEACKVAGGVATCMPVAEVPTCGCSGARQGCDAYNTDKQIFCVPVQGKTNIFPGTDCSLETPAQICSEGQCVPEDSTADTCAGRTVNGFYPVASECTSAAFCVTEKEIYRVKCDPGQYFNKAKAACEAFPPNPCTGCSKQKCPIISDCTKYAVCANGEVQDDDESCPNGEFFNPDTEACEGTAAGVCTDYEMCKFELTSIDDNNTSPVPDTTTTTTTTPITTTTNPPPTTTTTPPSTTTTTTNTPTPGPVDIPTKPAQCTAANANQRYPDEDDCKKYYTCRLIRGTTYSYVTSSCPGPYVYNPTNRFCDTAANVPGCVVAT